MKVRMDITKEIIGRIHRTFHRSMERRQSLLARMFSLIYLGDWVSYYLAILHGERPDAGGGDRSPQERSWGR